VRDTQALREHYALALRRWVHNLEENWDEAVRIAGAGRGGAPSWNTDRMATRSWLALRAGRDTP